MIKEALKVKGRVKVALNDVVVQEIDNLVVNTGLAFITSRMTDATDSVMSHMAVGSGSTAAAAGDTTLASEEGRVALTSTTDSTGQIVYVATFGAGTATASLQEAGLFNASSAGTMLCRTLFSGAVTKGINDSMTITWTITIS
jgi:hypothetical protein